MIPVGSLWGIVKDVGKFITSAIRKETAIPEVYVRVEVDGPHFANRTDIQSLIFSLTSRSGVTKVKQGRVRFYNPDNPREQDEQHTGEIQLFEGKDKDFRLPLVPIMFFDGVMSGKAHLKAECNLTLERPNGKPHQQDKRYTYDSKKHIFCEEHL